MVTLSTMLLFSHSVMSNSLWPHGLQHTRLPCPSPFPGVWSNSWPLSQWCHPTISSSVIPFSSCLHSFPASGSFQWVSPSQEVAKVLEPFTYILPNVPKSSTKWVPLLSHFTDKATNSGPEIGTALPSVGWTQKNSSRHILEQWAPNRGVPRESKFG